MRYVKIAFTRDGGALHPWGATLTAAPTVTRGPMYEMELLDDGSAKVLCQLYGDLDRGYELTRDHDLVRHVEVTDVDQGFMYLRVEMPTVSQEMLSFKHTTKLVLSTPLRFRSDGAAIATFVGTEEATGEALAEIPDGVEAELLETGRYQPEQNEAFAQLTPHQQQLLHLAVREGYYECPRMASQADLAAEIDLSPGTVGEHLRKIESRVFSQLVAE